MMRRNSPPRFPRHNSPSRRGGRPRELSPLSRSQPAPPGEERGRKVNPWDAPSPHKRPRTRSRSRERVVRAREGERDRIRGRMDREPPVISISEEERSRGRFDRGKEPPRAVLIKEPERLRERSRERHRVRDHVFPTPRLSENKEGKHKHHQQRRHSQERNRETNDVYEESYLDHQRNHFGNNGALHNNHEEPLLDPSSITFNAYPPESPRDTSREIRHTPTHPSPNTSFSNQEKGENAEDRINRLEKLVEKLVEVNVKPSKVKETSFSSPIKDRAKDIIPELIPSNNKYTTSMWINRIHEECLHRNYDEKSSIRFMQDKMTGLMKAWFKSVSNYNFTWPELKLLITETFPDNNEFSQTLKLLVSRDKRSEETITQYYFSKIYLCEACKITGENAVSCLIDGLSNPFMKQDIKSYNFLTPEALYAEYLSKFPEHDVPVRMDHREVRVEHREEPEYHNEDFIPLEMEDRGREYQMLSTQASNRGERIGKHILEPPRERTLERKKCFTCKKFGHLTIDCRHAPICYNCKKKGHIAAKCHYNNVMLISSGSNSHNKAPKVICKVQDKEFDGVIDTGAMPVTMKKSLAKVLQLKLEETSEVLKGYGGSMVLPLAEVHVNLMVNSIQRLVKVLIVDDKVQDYAVIIGQEFLSKGVSILIQNDNVNIIDFVTSCLEKPN